jgi:hypothetical protein
MVVEGVEHRHRSNALLDPRVVDHTEQLDLCASRGVVETRLN